MTKSGKIKSKSDKLTKFFLDFADVRKRKETKRSWLNASSRTRWNKMEMCGIRWKLQYHTRLGLG